MCVSWLHEPPNAIETSPKSPVIVILVSFVIQFALCT